MKVDAETEKRILELATHVNGKPTGDQSAPVVDCISEKEFQSAVIAEAKRYGWRHYHTWNSQRSAPGFPDLVLVRAGKLIFAELKRQSESPTAAQMNWLNDLWQCESDCVKTFVWRPGDWQKIVETLAEPVTGR